MTEFRRIALFADLRHPPQVRNHAKQARFAASRCDAVTLRMGATKVAALEARPHVT